jgi:ATP-dependent DNA ligase
VIDQREIYHWASRREDWRKIVCQDMEIARLKQEVERLEVELAGCSKCKGSASGTYGRLCGDCYFEERSSQEEAS